MFWDKKKYIIKLKGGGARFNTKEIRGLVEHLIVKPEKENTVWDMCIIDKDGDVIYDRRQYCGRLDDKEGLPVGKDTPEKLTVVLSNVSHNTSFDIIFRTREM